MATAAPEIPALARAQAFEVLYRRYAQDVYRYALALLRNPADAEDVTQTTFLNAYRVYMRGEEPLKPHNWLIKIAHNAARTRYARASRRVKEVPLEDHVDRLAVPEQDKPDIHAVLDALGRLPLNQRAALVMRELEGRRYTEIAETLGVSVPAVETLIFRARRSLRLKAAAIRALAVVPLPSSLSQLFDAGGVVAGGGAVIGSGLLLKAAVAVVAGLVATGVGGDHHMPKAATAPRIAGQPAVGSGSERRLRPDVAAGALAAGLALVKDQGAVGTAHPAARAREDGRASSTSPSTGGGSSVEASQAGDSSSAAATTTAPVIDLAGSATGTLPAALPLPVDVPPLPQPPAVTVPAPPPLPNLP
jgi:RNA polymerase sigma factor (sigma-70 family)